MIYWFYGPPGAGKTTIGKELARIADYSFLDADDIRPLFWSHLTWSIKDRVKNITALANMALAVESTGINVICAAVTPTAAMRTIVHDIVIDCKMIHLTAPFNILKARKPQLYENPPPNMTGIASPFEVSGKDLHFDTSSESVNEIIQCILKL